MIKSLCCLAEAEVSDPAAFLNLCARRCIALDGTESVDACRLRFRARSSAIPELQKLAEQCGGSLRVLREGAGERLRAQARRNALLLIPGAVLGVLLLLSSLFLWEIELECCPAGVERWQVMGALERAGLRKGAFVPALSPELICSEALETLPELGSLSVNIRGSRAVAEGWERVQAPPTAEEKGRVAVTADRQAVLTDVRVLSGTAMVNRGMAVAPGDVLVQPSATAEHARARISGLCRVEKTALLPKSSGAVAETGKKRSFWGFQWGKRCIFLQTDSSISPMVCGKIYSVSSRALPFGLCRILLRETERTESGEVCDESCAEKLLERLLAEELGKEGELRTAAVLRSGESMTVRCECVLPIGAEQAADR